MKRKRQTVPKGRRSNHASTTLIAVQDHPEPKNSGNPDRFAFTVAAVRSFAQDHTLWVLGLFPFCIAALKIMAISRGETQTVWYLLQNINILSLVLAATLPILPITAIWLFLMWYDRNRRLPEDEKVNVLERFWPILGPVAAILIMASQALSAIITLAVLVYAVLKRLMIIPWKNKKLKKKFGDNYSQLWVSQPFNAFTFLLVIFVQSIFTVNSDWLPTEAMKISNEPAITARIIDAQGSFTTYLRDDTEPAIVKTEQIASRQPCIVSKFDLSNSVAATVLRLFGKDDRPRCPRD